ncbi:tigger transposable element-derived protein 4-like [Latimeria chalumnae]|uniref:tigger transposable element-derived protein 4-like n=1 Tax=Latimeria chalumnae TaxID=7897 RepID=UPI0003C13747|nr:PREDICTED: tigger transposable element-derived protein 4-like [Latimeria chalumnae]|eukprot:XP_006005673.1 PREDICTED: tigger transposable element-derived protein 4-like [Latimeria chalumnae]
MSGKSYRSVSLLKKAEAIQDVKKGVSKKEVCRQYDVPRTTLNTWLKNEKKITGVIEEGTFNPDRKRMRMGDYSDIEERLVPWLRQARANNIPVSGPILLAKANEFATQLGITDFKCSQGWMDRFKARHSIMLKQACGEANAAPLASVEQWKTTTLVSILREYKPADIYNANETGLFWRMLPNKTLAFKGEKCTGGKHSDQRVTVLITANMEGSDKRDLLVIGKSQNPRCLKGVRLKSVTYTANEKAWMTSSEFEKFVRNFDADMTKQKRKVALVIDNCPAHPTKISGLKSVKLFFLPPNTTARTQPMDSGVIRNFKCHYRRLLLSRLLIEIDVGRTYALDILKAINLMKDAWKSVLPNTVANCFAHCGFKKEDTAPQDNDEFEDFDPADMHGLHRRLRNLGMWPRDLSPYDFVDVDNDVSVAELSTDDDIVAAVKNRTSADVIGAIEDGDEVGEEEMEIPPPPPPVKLADAMAGLDTFRLYLSQNDIEEKQHHLSTWSSVLASRVCIEGKQKPNFFQ